MLLSSEFLTIERVAVGKRIKILPFLGLFLGLWLEICPAAGSVGRPTELIMENPCVCWCVCIRLRKLETYHEYKEAASAYQEAWSALRKQAFGSWIRNPPDYHQFK